MISLMKLVEGKYDYGCVMARIDEKYTQRLLEFNHKTISEDIIYKEGNEYGRENNPHITLKYGLVNSYTEEQIKKILHKFTPFNVEVKKLSIFENDKYDVIKFDVESPILRQLNEVFSMLPNHDEYPDYQPHMTLAYVNKGMGNRFIKTPRKTACIPVRTVEYSDRGIKTYYTLGEGLTKRNFDAEIYQLEKEWERLDNMGGMETKQREIILKINNLNKEKKKWDRLYKSAL